MFAFVSKVLGRNRTSITKPARRLVRPRLLCEALEARQLLSVAGEFHVNTTTRNDQTDSASASSAIGTSVVVWTDEFSSNDLDIRAQVYDANGNRLGDEIVVAASSKHEYAPAVAMDALGNFVVVWTLDFSSTDQDVYAARFSANGTRLGSDFSIAASSQNESAASIAMAANGSFVVSYTYDFSATDQDVRARMFTASGGYLREISVADSPGPEHRSSVASAPDGRFVIAYQRDYAGLDRDIHVARYTAAGGLLSNQALDSSSRSDINPSVSVDDFGNAVVVYQAFVGNDWDVKARRVSSSGGLGSELTIAASLAHEEHPSVALDPTNGRFVVAYRVGGSGISPSQVHLAEVSANDVVSGTTNLGSGLLDPAVSITRDGTHRYLVTYTRSNAAGDAGFGIYGRFGSLDAAFASAVLQESLQRERLAFDVDPADWLMA